VVVIMRHYSNGDGHKQKPHINKRINTSPYPLDYK
jgi:hypothetical protein